MLSLSSGLAMDLGTANTLIYEKSRGIILNEPSIVAVDTDTREVLAVGTEAKSYLGRTPRNIEVIRPLQCGVINDYEVTRQMIVNLLTMAKVNRRLFKPVIVVGVPNSSTQVEKRAIIEAAQQAGGKSIHLVNEPIAAAIGLGLPIMEPQAQMVLDVGGGTSEGVIISMGAAAVEDARRVAGDAATEAIIRYLKQRYGMAIGNNMAEDVKHTIGSALPLKDKRTYTCRGKDLHNGTPVSREITDKDIRVALEDINSEFINMVKRVVAQCPPALSADLLLGGLHLTGGGGMLKGLSYRLNRELKMKIHVPDNPLLSVVNGLGKIVEDMSFYQDVFVN